MIPHSDDFTSTADVTATDAYAMYIENIKNIKLHVRTVKVNQQAVMAIHRTLQKREAMCSTPVPYLTMHIIENDGFTWEKGNVFNGKIPTILMFGIVKNNAYNRSLRENPFHYQNVNITEAKIYITGIPVFHAIETDCTGNYHEGFLQILKATGDLSCLLNMHTWNNQPIFCTSFDTERKKRISRISSTSKQKSKN